MNKLVVNRNSLFHMAQSPTSRGIHCERDMVPEELKETSLGRLFLFCLFFLVTSFFCGIIGFTESTWGAFVNLSQVALVMIMPSNKDDGKESKSLFRFFHKRSKSKDTDDERDERSEPQRSTEKRRGQYDEVTSDTAEGRTTDETHGGFIVTTSPQPRSETKNSSAHVLHDQVESDPVSLAFPEGTSGDDQDSEEEIIFLRDRVRELSESLLETQQKLAVTRKALLLKTEQYARL